MELFNYEEKQVRTTMLTGKGQLFLLDKIKRMN